MTNRDLGQMYMFNDRALIARSSSKVLFFKQVVVPDDERDESTILYPEPAIRAGPGIPDLIEWRQYFELEIRGFIYFIRGNKRIQVTSDTNIYFYLIDPETCEPRLENVMHNYMDCNQMMFGSKVRYGITYKTNEKSFNVYKRKFTHDFIVKIDDQNLEGALSVDLPAEGLYLVAKIDEIEVYSSTTFQKKGMIPIKLLPSEGREANQIIAMQVSPDEQYLAVFSGKNLIMKQQKVNQMFIYKKMGDEFKIFKHAMVKDLPRFNQVCMQFHFKKGEKTTSLILVR